MTKGFLSRRSRLRLSALVFGGLICGSTASAADLVAATASNYSQSDIGTVTGSRVTTDVDVTPRKAILKDQGGDAAFYNFHQDGLSQLLLRKYGYSPVASPSLIYDTNALGSAGAKIAEGAITASANTHSVAATSTAIYTTGYDLGKIGVAKRSGANLVEDTTATIDLKSDIKNHAHYDFNGTYEIHENNGTVTQKTGSEAAAKVHGESLLIDGRNLYVAASVNPNGGYQPYDDSFLIQYRIKDDGSLEYGSHTRIVRNIDQSRLNRFNEYILVSGVGGYQHSDGTGNTHHTAISIAKIDNSGSLVSTTSQSVKLPAHVATTGQDMRDLKVLPNGTAYIMTYNLDGGSNLKGAVYQTTVSNLLSSTPDDWTKVKELNGAGWFGTLKAEQYTKRLWIEEGQALHVYEDGASTPTHTWQAQDFASDSSFFQFNKVTEIAPDHVTGALAAVNLALPTELGGTTTAAAANEPMACGRPNSSMRTLRISMVMIPSKATMASSFFGVLNMMEKPPAASAAAIA